MLNERRAEFVYDGARLAAIAAQAPVVPVPWSEREEPFRKQFREVIERQCGEQRSRSPEELHGSWMQAYIEMGWKYSEVYDREKKTHPDMVPYADLGQLEQDKDSVFIALCEIARQWVYASKECDTNTDAPTGFVTVGAPRLSVKTLGQLMCNHWPSQSRCEVCGMGMKSREEGTEKP